MSDNLRDLAARERTGLDGQSAVEPDWAHLSRVFAADYYGHAEDEAVCCTTCGAEIGEACREVT